eukprot:Opistho-2@14479
MKSSVSQAAPRALANCFPGLAAPHVSRRPLFAQRSLASASARLIFGTSQSVFVSSVGVSESLSRCIHRIPSNVHPQLSRSMATSTSNAGVSLTAAGEGPVYINTHLEYVAPFFEKDLRAVVRRIPGYENAEPRFSRISGALSNIVIKCDFAECASQCKSLLCRIFGQDNDVMSREDEENIFHELAEKSFGPDLIAKFKNGRFEQFLNGRPLLAPEMRDGPVADLVAQKLRVLHGLNMMRIRRDNVLVYRALQGWLDEVLKLPRGANALRDKLAATGPAEVTWLISQLRAREGPVVFCHNDLQHGNILMLTDGSVAFIDFEYAGYNPRGFDFANHFCEWMCDYNLDDCHVPRTQWHPSDEQQRRFARAYLGDGASDEEIDAIIGEAQRFSAASHLLWSMWGVVQTGTSKANSFDYAEYANQRYAGYIRSRDAYLSKESAPPHHTGLL